MVFTFHYIQTFAKVKYLIGIQPTGRLHIGNYLGCIKKGLEYQAQGHEVVFMIANYHSLTTVGEVANTEQELKRLGCINVVRQTPEHLEVYFKLTCKLNQGILLKMPQYKDKKDSVEYDLGLLLYPVLMCADIIHINPDVVIVGRDQVAHIELCNDIAKRIGCDKHFEYELGDMEKVMSLRAPDKKMSKSLGEEHVLYLLDEDYEAKLRKAVTTPEGVDNLKAIARHLNISDDDTSKLELKERIADRMKVLFADETQQLPE